MGSKRKKLVLISLKLHQLTQIPAEKVCAFCISIEHVHVVNYKTSNLVGTNYTLTCIRTGIEYLTCTNDTKLQSL